MNINFSCINMDHSAYLRNYIENKLHEKIFLLICLPIEVDITIRTTHEMKYISCEVVTIDGATFYIEYASYDVHQAVDDVLDRVIILLNRRENKMQNMRNSYSENVIDLSARRRHSSRDYQTHQH